MAVYHRVEQDRTNDWRRVSPAEKYALTPCSKHAGGVQMMFLRPLSLSLFLPTHAHTRNYSHMQTYTVPRSFLYVRGAVLTKLLMKDKKAFFLNSLLNVLANFLLFCWVCSPQNVGGRPGDNNMGEGAKQTLLEGDGGSRRKGILLLPLRQEKTWCCLLKDIKRNCTLNRKV